MSNGEDLSPLVAWRAGWVDRADRLGRSADPAIRRAELLAARQGFVLTVGQARTAGVPRALQRSLVRRRSWSAPRYGALAVVHARGYLRAESALAAAAAAMMRAGSVISHESAAILHGLPVRRAPAGARLTICPSRPSGSRTDALHRADIDATETADWFGAALTNIPRTVMDLARADLGAGLIAADAALRERVTSVAALRAMAVRCSGWPGSTSARWVADHADPLSESPLESLVRACLLRGGLPRAQLQAEIRDVDGWYARVDLLWREQRVIVEADGRLKYRDDGRSLWREKRRQERLERMGFRVVRVLWSDIESDIPTTIARVRSALRGRPAGRSD